MILKLARSLTKQWGDKGMCNTDDLISVGLFGVYESMPRFDVSHRARFETYAGRRASGAMRDEMRSADPLSRSERTRLKKAGKDFCVGSIDHAGNDQDETLSLHDDADPVGERMDQLESISRHLVGLGTDERLMIRMRFENDLSMKEIGRAIGLSESRVSQMLSSVMLRLKAKLTAEAGEI